MQANYKIGKLKKSAPCEERNHKEDSPRRKIDEDRCKRDMRTNSKTDKPEKSAPCEGKKHKEDPLKSKIDEDHRKKKKINCNCEKKITIYTLVSPEETIYSSKKKKKL